MSEERRLVTILFADVVGSTSLGESIDPEDVRALLARLFAIASDAIGQRGGRVEKFIGDAIMAVFGLPMAHDDDPARALSAALDLRDRVREDPALGARIAIRLGVNSGEVIATRDADASQFLVTGDPVNTAARLQSAGDAWDILVGERTAAAVGARFDFGEPIDVEAKGKARPVPARLLIGAAALPAPRGRSRIVGRGADLEQLALTSRRAFEERRPFLISVVAPAGVGKSRLLEEFLDGLDPGVHVAIAQCLPYGQLLTYWPMRSILLSIIGLADDATPEQVRAAVLAWVRDAGDADAAETAELLSATIGASEAETSDRLALFAAWRRFVELAAEAAPLVLVIEDLHWSSDSLLDLIETILQPKADVPLLMVALARPELLDRRPSWGGGRRNAISISLEPLPDRAVTELVGDLLPGASDEIAQAVVARAEGNPFYAGEIVRALRDRLGDDPSGAAVVPAIGSLPDTVQATVLARLDALEPTARRVVQLGAVIGRSFPTRAIAALEPALGDAETEAATSLLIDRDMLRPSGRGSVTFRHILIREVAYGTLPRSERARLHAAAGGWLERDAIETGREDELAELVAFHLREAISLAGLLGETVDPAQAATAVTWLRRAAEVAFGGGANVEAARHLEAACDLAPSAVQAEILERLGTVWTGGDQALEAFERAYELGRELDLGPEQQLRTLSQTAITYSRWVGSMSTRWSREEQDSRFDEIDRLFGLATDERSIALGWLARAFRRGIGDQRPPEQLEQGRQDALVAVRLARALDDADMISAALDALDAIALSDNRFSEVPEVIAERLALGSRLSSGERLDSWIVGAWAMTTLGRLDDAERSAAAAVAGLVSGQTPSWVGGASAWRVLDLYALGRWDEAMAEALRMQRALAESEIRAPGFAMNGIVAAYQISRARGDTVDADAWRAMATTVLDRSDAVVRGQRVRPLLGGDLHRLVPDVVEQFMLFSGRFDTVSLCLFELADARVPADAVSLDELIRYTDERALAFISAPAYRYRGILRRDPTDLRSALDQFQAMGAMTFVARVQAELGLLAGDSVAVETAISRLEAIGDGLHARRLAGELRAGGWAAPAVAAS